MRRFSILFTVLICTAILLILVNQPLYHQGRDKFDAWTMYLSSKKQAEYQIGAIYNAAKMYVGDRDDWPPSSRILEEWGYLTLDDGPWIQNWSFRIVSTAYIEGVYYSEKAPGFRRIVRYDIVKGEFLRLSGIETKKADSLFRLYSVIVNARKAYHKKTGEIPGSINDLVAERCLLEGQEATKYWKLELKGLYELVAIPVDSAASNEAKVSLSLNHFFK